MLLASPTGNNIYIIMNMLVNRRFQHLLRDVLREQYKPNFVQFIPALTLPLYVTGCFSGIVVDCGFTQTEIMAVVEGVPLKKTLDYRTAGGLQVIMKALELYKQMDTVSRSLQETLETDFDTLSSICVV